MSRIALGTTLGRPLLRYAGPLDHLRQLPPDLPEELRKLFERPPHEGWFHASPHDLPVGTKLVPGGAPAASKDFYDQGWGSDRGNLMDMGGGRSEHVWMTPYREDANFWSAVNNAPHIYEVAPHEDPRPWNGTGTDGWVTPAATIVRKVKGPKNAMMGIEPTMNVRRQVNKFDTRIQDARNQGDHQLADYFEHLKGQMLDGVEQGKPQPFSHWLPMAQEEFGDHVAYIDDTPYLNAIWDEDLDDDDPEPVLPRRRRR